MKSESLSDHHSTVVADEDTTKQQQPNSLTKPLNLSLRHHNTKREPTGTSSTDEYFSALSPVSTSSATNLSTTNTINSSSSSQKLSTKLVQDTSNVATSINAKQRGHTILDVIDRLKSQKCCPGVDQQEEVMTETGQCLSEHNDGGIHELNELIRSHLLPISDAVFDIRHKYKAYFNGRNKNKAGSSSQFENCDQENEEEEDGERTEEEEEEGEEENDSHNHKEQHQHLKSNERTAKQQCTFCNIFKNLIDLHELLHKT